METIIPIVAYDLMSLSDKSKINAIMSKNTGFKTFPAMMKSTREHGYRPTVEITDIEHFYIAKIYDVTCEYEDLVERAFVSSRSSFKPKLTTLIRAVRSGAIIKAIADAREIGAGHAENTEYEIGCYGSDGNLVGDKATPKRISAKAVREYIAECEGIAECFVMDGDWKYTYCVSGRIDVAKHGAHMRINFDDWVGSGWNEMHTYWDVLVESPDDFGKVK